ncbi:MAG: hypothetical protein AAF236_04245, partial [Verrucomicrobiota bacterium]
MIRLRSLLTVASFLALGILHAQEALPELDAVPSGGEIVEVAKSGVIFKTAEGGYGLLPWAKVPETEKSVLTQRFRDQVRNAMADAYRVKGTVFHAVAEGIIVQIDLTDEAAEIGFEGGAEVLTNGLVLIQDLPKDTPVGAGATIDAVGYRIGTYRFNMGIAVKEIPHLTAVLPDWTGEMEWTNAEGKVMTARLVGVKEGKGLFERSGQRFLVPIESLDAEGQERAAEIAEK